MSVTSCLSITTYVCDSILLSSSSPLLFYSQFFLILFPFVYTNNHHKRVSEMPMLHVLVLPKGTFNIAISEFHLSIHMFIESLILIDNTILLNSIQQSFNPTILLFSLLESQPFKNSPLATTNRIWVVAPIKRAVDDGTAKVSYSTKSEWHELYIATCVSNLLFTFIPHHITCSHTHLSFTILIYHLLSQILSKGTYGCRI